MKSLRHTLTILSASGIFAATLLTGLSISSVVFDS